MALAGQLSRLQEQNVPFGGGRHGSLPSLLFTREEAAKIPLSDIASLGANGFTQLAPVLPAHLAKSTTISQLLFSGSTVDRRTLAPGVESKVHAAVIQFLTLGIAPHLPGRPAVKCLEWLLRGWNLPEHDEELKVLLLVALPFHSVLPFFPRLLRSLGFGSQNSIDRMSKSSQRMFGFLAEFASTKNVSTALRRDVIEQNAAWDLLLELGRVARKASVSAGAVLPIPTATFYAALVSDRIIAMSSGRSVAVSQRDLLRTVIAQAVEGIAIKPRSEESVFQDYRAACVAILLALGVAEAGSGRLGLLGDGHENLLYTAAAEVLAKRISETPSSGTSTLITTLVALHACQEKLPEKAVNYLAKSSGCLGKELHNILQSATLGEAGSHFINCYSKQAASIVASHINYVKSLSLWISSAPIERIPGLPALTLYTALKTLASASFSATEIEESFAALKMACESRRISTKDVDDTVGMFLQSGGSPEWITWLQSRSITDKEKAEQPNVQYHHPEAKVRITAYRTILANPSNFESHNLKDVVLRCLFDPEKTVSEIALSSDEAILQVDMEAMHASLPAAKVRNTEIVSKFVMRLLDLKADMGERQIADFVGVLLFCMRPGLPLATRIESGQILVRRSRLINLASFGWVALLNMSECQSSADIDSAIVAAWRDSYRESKTGYGENILTSITSLALLLQHTDGVEWALRLLAVLMEELSTKPQQAFPMTTSLEDLVKTIVQWRNAIHCKSFPQALLSILNLTEIKSRAGVDERYDVYQAVGLILEHCTGTDVLLGIIAQISWLQNDAWLWAVCVSQNASESRRSNALKLYTAFNIFRGNEIERLLAITVDFASSESHLRRASACTCIGAVASQLNRLESSESFSGLIQFLARRLDDIERYGCLSLLFQPNEAQDSVVSIEDWTNYDEYPASVKRSLISLTGKFSKGKKSSRAALSKAWELFASSKSNEDLVILFEQPTKETCDKEKNEELFRIALEHVNECDPVSLNPQTRAGLSFVLRVWDDFSLEQQKSFLSVMLEKSTTSPGAVELRTALGTSLLARPSLLAEDTRKRPDDQAISSMAHRLCALESIHQHVDSLAFTEDLFESLLAILKQPSRDATIEDSDSLILSIIGAMMNHSAAVDCYSTTASKGLLLAFLERSKGGLNGHLKAKKYFPILTSTLQRVEAAADKQVLASQVIAVCESYASLEREDIPILQTLDLLLVFKVELLHNSAAQLFVHSLIPRVFNGKASAEVSQQFHALKNFYEEMESIGKGASSWNLMSQISGHVQIELDGVSGATKLTSPIYFEFFDFLSCPEVALLLGLLGKDKTREDLFALPFGEVSARMAVLCSQLQREDIRSFMETTSSRNVVIGVVESILRGLEDIRCCQWSTEPFEDQKHEGAGIFYSECLALLEGPLAYISLSCIWDAAKKKISVDLGAGLDIINVKLRVARVSDAQQLGRSKTNEIASAFIDLWPSTSRPDQRLFEIIERLLAMSSEKLSRETWLRIFDKVLVEYHALVKLGNNQTAIGSALLCIASLIRVGCRHHDTSGVLARAISLVSDQAASRFIRHDEPFLRVLLAVADTAPQYLVGEGLQSVIHLLCCAAVTYSSSKIVLLRIAQVCEPRLSFKALMSIKGAYLTGGRIQAFRFVVREMSASAMRDHLDLIQDLSCQLIDALRPDYCSQIAISWAEETLGKAVTNVSMQLPEQLFRSFLAFLFAFIKTFTEEFAGHHFAHLLFRMLKSMSETFQSVFCSHFQVIVLPYLRNEVSSTYEEALEVYGKGSEGFPIQTDRKATSAEPLALPLGYNEQELRWDSRVDHFDVQLQMLSLHFEHSELDIDETEVDDLLGDVSTSFGLTCLTAASEHEQSSTVRGSWLQYVSRFAAWLSNQKSIDRDRVRETLCLLSRRLLKVPKKLSKRCAKPTNGNADLPLVLALDALTAITEAVGHEFLCTLPETMPSLASAISNHETETAARKLVVAFERLSGESLLPQLAA